jgi:lysophospholipase L1-like esterase
VVVLGDSFTVGVGSDAEAGYVGALADRMDWTVVPEAESGTGYVNPGSEPGLEVYGGRVASVVAEAPDIVLVQGSTNDVGAGSPADIGRAAADVYAALAAALPEARVVVLGPLDSPVVDRDGVLAARDAVAGAAARAGLPFIDPIEENWLDSPELFADGLHPDDPGYAEFAGDLTDALRDLGF